MELNDEKAVEGRLEDFGPAPLHQRLRLEALLKYCRSSGISTCIRFDKRICLAVILVHSGYYLGAAVGMALTFQPHAVSVLWPPNSILMGALLLAPMRLWWLFILAAFPAHLAAELPRGVPFMMTSCWFLSNCSEAFLGAAVIRLLLPNLIRFNSLDSIWVFFACGGFLAPFLSSFLDAGFVVWNGFGSEPYWRIWQMRFVSNAMTTLIITPVVVSVGSLNWGAWRTTSRKRIIEAISLAVGLCVVTVTVFCVSPHGTWTTPLFVYAPLPFLLWAAVRFGPAASSAGILGVALLAIWGAVHELGPFASSLPSESALAMQLFFIVISITLLSLSVVLHERKQMQQAFQDSEERYRDVVDSHTDLICRYTSDTTLTFVNESYCRFFKMPRESLLGKKFLDLIPPSSRGTLHVKIQTMAREGSSATIEHEVCLPDGSIGWQSWTDRPVFGDDGQIIEFQGIGRDVTERKRTEQAQLELAHTSRLVLAGELTAMVAHEIHQPLGAILSNAETAEMLLQSSSPNLIEIREIVQDIRKDNLRASEAIRRIRSLLRKRPMEMLPVSLNDIVSDVLQLVSGDILLRRVQIDKHLSPAIPLIAGDRVHLQQVLLNLVLNGMEAMAHLAGSRRLTIRTNTIESGAVQLAVADSGPGIPAERLSRVFDFFFSTKPHGMGVGLAIARSIVEAHGGNISAENNSGEGALFRCQFPVPVGTG